jgi:hypothetical protein
MFDKEDIDTAVSSLSISNSIQNYTPSLVADVKLVAQSCRLLSS